MERSVAISLPVSERINYFHLLCVTNDERKVTWQHLFSNIIEHYVFRKKEKKNVMTLDHKDEYKKTMTLFRAQPNIIDG